MGRVYHKMKRLNIADYFSIYRLVALPIIIGAIILEKRTATGILLLISFLTDAIDGYIARKRQMESSRGAKLDSIGDFLTLIAGFIAFALFETEFLKDHLWIIILSFSLFILQMIIALIKFKMLTSYHTFLAKITAVLFAVFLVITPIAAPFKFLFYLSFVISIAEALEEIVITLILKEPQENVKGLYWMLKTHSSA